MSSILTPPQPDGVSAAPGYDLFIVHADADRAWVEGYLKPALGLEPGRAITPGDFALGAPIAAEFDRAVASSRYSVLVLSPAFLADRWSEFGEQLVSYTSVEKGRGRLVALTLHPCQPPPRLRFRVGLDCIDSTRWNEEVQRLRDLLDRPEPPPERIACPYPGMRPFADGFERFFFGRDAEIEGMVRHFRNHRFLFVIGPSGSGKSSLVRAGLLPALERSRTVPPGYWRFRQMRPGARPVERLADVLEGDPSAPEPALARLLDADPPAGRLLLVIDQFEELFTQVEERAERSRFLDALAALRASERCALLIALRADFYADLMTSAFPPIDPSERLEVRPLRGEALRQAIERPARDVGVHLEPGLLERLLADAADEPGVLPLVQETMALLWDGMKRRLIPLGDYERLGGDGRSGLAVAMANKADATLADLSPQQQKIARRIFLRLVQFGEGRSDTRRQLTIDELRSAGDDRALFDRTLDHLIANRLLTPDRPSEARGPVVDIAHEMLIIGWPRSQQWVKERREAELARRRFEAKAKDWARRDRVGGLLDMVELAEADHWIRADAEELGCEPLLQEYVDASRAELDRIEARRRLGIAILAVAAGLIITLIIAFLVVREQDARIIASQERDRAEEQKAAAEEQARLRVEAEDQRDEALSRQLAAQAVANRDEQIDLALLLGVEACRIRPTVEARNALYSAMESHPDIRAFLLRDGPAVSEVVFSPDGKTLAANLVDGSIVFVDAASRRRLGEPLRGRGGPLSLPVFTRGGKVLATLDGDGTSVFFWDVATREPLGEPLRTGPEKVEDLACDLEGTLLAKATGLGSLSLWDLRTRTHLADDRIGREKDVWTVALSPDGKALACGKNDHSVVWWDLSGPEPRRTELPGSSKGGEQNIPVHGLAFSPDGKRLASGWPGNIVVWDLLEQKTLIQRFTRVGLDGKVLAFSANGKTLASALEHEIFLSFPDFSPPSGRTLKAHPVPITSLAFSPDGRTLASASYAEPGVILWDWPSRQTRLGRPFSSYYRASGASFSPDGKWLATPHPEGSCVIWDVATGKKERITNLAAGGLMIFSPRDPILAATHQPAFSLRNATGEIVRKPAATPQKDVLCLAFSPDGTILASGSRDDTIVLWAIPACTPIGPPLFAGGGAVRNVAFSGDGATLAAACKDGKVRLWDVATRQPCGRPLVGQTGSVECLAFSPDSKKLAIGGKGGAIQLWDVTTPEPSESRLTTFKRYGGYLSSRADVICLAFSPDSRTLASVSQEGVTLWDIATRQPFVTSLGPGRGNTLTGLAFSPDGKTLALTLDPGRTLPADTIVYDVSLDSWKARACLIANRNLSREEWNRFMGPDLPYHCPCADLPDGRGVDEAAGQGVTPGR
jgi:WD40 repeat protein